MTDTGTPQRSNNQSKVPFGFTYSPQLPELLLDLNISIAISTYQADKIVIVSPKDENSFVSLPRTFIKPMGMDFNENRMVVACKDSVVLLENSKNLAESYPNKPNTYDNLYIPRATFYTGMVDMHDIKFGKDEIWAINSSFSCLCIINGNHNFIPKWKPKFISKLASEDRCHLNGLVMKDGRPKYVTALGTGDKPQSWRDSIVDGGVLIDVTTDEILFENLPMPHSPMIYKDELYVLLSASGQLAKLNIETKKVEIIKDLDGFCRGMDIVDDYAFIGMSKLRKNSSTFAKLPFAERALTAGVKVIHLPTKSFVGELIYQASVDEIYEIKIMKDMIRPNVLNTLNDIHKYALSIPGKTFWAKPNNDNQQ